MTYSLTTIVITNMAKIDVKVVMLGKEYSGKTSIVERFLSESFGGENRYQSTIGVAYGARYLSEVKCQTRKPDQLKVFRKLVVNGKEVDLGVWDTAGSERFDSMTRMYYRKIIHFTILVQ